MRKLFQMTIWAPGAIPADEWKYRNLKRVMFPVIDLLFIMAGISAVRNGIPAISNFFPEVVTDVYSVLLILVATICLIGVSLPDQWRLEMLGKTILFGLMVGYVVALFILLVIGEEGRGFILLIASITLTPIVWRLSLLGSEWQLRRLAEKLLEEQESDAAATKAAKGGV